MIYLQILTAIAGIVLLYLGIVIVALLTMAAIRGMQYLIQFSRAARFALIQRLRAKGRIA